MRLIPAGQHHFDDEKPRVIRHRFAHIPEDGQALRLAPVMNDMR